MPPPSTSHSLPPTPTLLLPPSYFLHLPLSGHGPAESTANYAEAVFGKYGVRLEPGSELGGELGGDCWGECGGADGRWALTPMLRYMDNVALVSVAFLKEEIFVAGSGVRRGTFIEDTFGKQTQMQAWLRSAAFAAKRPPSNGCFLISDGRREPMMRHLDGKTYLDPDQRAEAGLPAYPTDWTVALSV